MSTTWAGTTPDGVEAPPKRGVGGLLARYKTAYQVARASLFWALLRRQKRTIGWAFFFLFFTFAPTLLILNFVRGMVDNAIVDQTVPIWPYVTHIMLWAVVATFGQFWATFLVLRIGYQM
jgi:hypothetical protein